MIWIQKDETKWLLRTVEICDVFARAENIHRLSMYCIMMNDTVHHTCPSYICIWLYMYIIQIWLDYIRLFFACLHQVSMFDGDLYQCLVKQLLFQALILLPIRWNNMIKRLPKEHLPPGRTGTVTYREYLLTQWGLRDSVRLRSNHHIFSFAARGYGRTAGIGWTSAGVPTLWASPCSNSGSGHFLWDLGRIIFLGYDWGSAHVCIYIYIFINHTL